MAQGTAYYDYKNIKEVSHIKSQDFYQQYISSDKWKHKRLLRLKIDKFRCRTCWNEENLEVHHLTYERLGDEDLEDLITLCKDCHEAITSIIRHRRYVKNGKTNFNNVDERILNYVEKSRNEVGWDGSAIDAQRPVSRSAKSGGKRNEEDFWQAF